MCLWDFSYGAWSLRGLGEIVHDTHGDMGTSVLYHNILQPNTSSSVLARLLLCFVVIDNLVSVYLKVRGYST